MQLRFSLYLKTVMNYSDRGIKGTTQTPKTLFNKRFTDTGRTN